MHLRPILRRKMGQNCKINTSGAWSTLRVSGKVSQFRTVFTRLPSRTSTTRYIYLAFFHTEYLAYSPIREKPCETSILCRTGTPRTPALVRGRSVKVLVAPSALGRDALLPMLQEQLLILPSRPSHRSGEFTMRGVVRADVPLVPIPAQPPRAILSRPRHLASLSHVSNACH